MRKQLTKAQRMQVYDKYSGHCAYCGRLIAYNEMQVDHLKPVANYRNLTEEETRSMDNYMPACRRCNHYKRANSLEGWRRMIEKIPYKLDRDSYIYKVGVDYGLIEQKPHKVIFYFEREGEQE